MKPNNCKATHCGENAMCATKNMPAHLCSKTFDRCLVHVGPSFDFVPAFRRRYGSSGNVSVV